MDPFLTVFMQLRENDFTGHRKSIVDSLRDVKTHEKYVLTENANLDVVK